MTNVGLEEYTPVNRYVVSTIGLGPRTYQRKRRDLDSILILKLIVRTCDATKAAGHWNL